MADKKPIETVDGLVDDSKKPLWRRAYDMVFAESLEDVKKSVLRDIVIPYVKDFFFELFTGSIERSIYGTSRSKYALRGGSTRAPLRGARTSYEPYYKQQQNKADDDELYEPVVMESRVKAEKVLSILQARIDQYEVATINDLNDCIKRTGKFTDEYYGWRDLSGVVIRKLSLNEYLVDFPEPVQVAKKGRSYSYEV